MTNEREGRAWDVARFAASGAPVEEVIERALQAKADITRHAYELWRQAVVVDGVISLLAPDLEWTSGWATDLIAEPAQYVELVPTRKITDRSQRGLEIAEEMANAGSGVVTSKAVAEQLSAEGYEGKLRDISVSIGNLLFRSDNWLKAEAGQYHFVG